MQSIERPTEVATLPSGPIEYWPDRLTRLGAHVAFAPGVEALAWAAGRLLTRRPGPLGLMLGSLSTLPSRQAAALLSITEIEALQAVFGSMRSGRGFLNDLRPGPDLSSAIIERIHRFLTAPTTPPADGSLSPS